MTDLNRNLRSNISDVKRIVDLVGDDPQLANKFNKATQLSAIQGLSAEYNVSQSVIFRVIAELKKNAIVIPTMNRDISVVVHDNSDITVDINGKLEKTKGGFQFEGERLTAHEMKKQMCETVISYYKMDGNKFVLETDTSSLHEKFQTNKSQQLHLGAILEDAKVASIPAAVSALETSISATGTGNNMKLSATAEIVKDIAPESVSPHMLPKNNELFLIPQSIKIPNIGTTEMFIKLMIERISKKSRYAGIANKHIYGTNFAGSSKYIDFLIDMKNVIINYNEYKKIFIHTKDSMYGIALSNSYPGKCIHYIGQPNEIRKEQLYAMNIHKMQQETGLHILMDVQGATVKKESDTYEVYRYQSEPEVEFARGLNGVCIRKIKVFATRTEFTYVPSVALRKGEVWEAYDNSFYSRQDLLGIVAQGLFHWYFFPWTRKILYGNAQWVPDPVGRFNLKAKGKEEIKMLFGDLVSDDINEFLEIFKDNDDNNNNNGVDAVEEKDDAPDENRLVKNKKKEENPIAAANKAANEWEGMDFGPP